MFKFYQCVIKFQMSYTFFEPIRKLLLLDLSYGFSSRVIQCTFVFTVKNKVIYFQLSIPDNIQNLIKQYMHMKSHTLNKALVQDYCTTSTNEQYQAMHETSCHHFAYHLQVRQFVKKLSIRRQILLNIHFFLFDYLVNGGLIIVARKAAHLHRFGGLLSNKRCLQLDCSQISF